MPTQTQPIGEIPNEAHARLKRMKNKLFTSDLSVNEFFLVKEAGFDPVGLVVGSSIYHIGYQQTNWRKNEEMVVLTQAMYHSRELAMQRMQEEAAELGADGIVGVRLNIKHMRWDSDTHLAEFVAIGTAVTHKDGDGRFRAPGGLPFTSDLSGQDFWTTLKAGYRPVGMVMGNCVYHIAYQGFRSWFRNLGQNVEMPEFTAGKYSARELAMERMQEEAEKLEANGIIGVDLHEGCHSWDSHVIEFFGIGTAVVPISDDHHIETPVRVLSLND